MGISYSRSGLAIDNPSSYSDPQNGLLTSIGVVINNKVFANPPAPGGTTIQNFSYLDLPFIARYKFIDRKFDISLSGGIYTSFLMSSNAYVQTIDNQKNQIGQTDNVARFNYSGAVGIGSVSYTHLDVYKRQEQYRSDQQRIGLKVEQHIKYCV